MLTTCLEKEKERCNYLASVWTVDNRTCKKKRKVTKVQNRNEMLGIGRRVEPSSRGKEIKQ